MNPYKTPVQSSDRPSSLNNKQGIINFLFGLACIAVIIYFAPVLIPLALSMWAWIIQASLASLVTSMLITASPITHINPNDLLIESYRCDRNNNTIIETGRIPVTDIDATPLLIESRHDPANTEQELINIPNNNLYTSFVEIDQNIMHATTNRPNHPFYVPLAITASAAG